MDFQLYYDEQLGRWVDKNAPDEGENKPPPPPMIPKSTFQNILNVKNTDVLVLIELKRIQDLLQRLRLHTWRQRGANFAVDG